MGQYILSVDQSTQGTKALLFDAEGHLLLRRDKAHAQLVNEKGWVSHDAEEIYQNTLEVLRAVVQDAGIDAAQIAALGISNQRETSLAWDRASGLPAALAIVWQCSRAENLCQGLASKKELVQNLSGIPLSPYFPAAKFVWLLQNEPNVQRLLSAGRLCLGTVDSYLVFRLSGGTHFCTDESNASRTQLFNLKTAAFDERLCAVFGVPMTCLPEVLDSDGDFGETDLEGFLPHKIPIRAVLGDSHAALFGQGCLTAGMVKATYGTGSSIMMNAGEQLVMSKSGLVSSVGFKLFGKRSYVLEGNLNYTGAVITWLKKDLGLIETDAETEALAFAANPEDQTCLVPAFSGLGAPYWNSEARAAFIGMSRTTGRAELARAALACIAQQITDVLEAMQQDVGAQLPIKALRVDGGPTKNAYLMQLQSDLAACTVQKPDAEELSGIGAAYAAGIACGVYTDKVLDVLKRTAYEPKLDAVERARQRGSWQRAVARVL